MRCTGHTAHRSAEYKQVTVLFADVVRSMDIAAALDMERLREIMTELVERSAAVLQPLWRNRGVHRRRGDGDLRRPGGVGGSRFSGCLAALAIQEETKRLAAEVSAATVWICRCGWG